MSEDQLNLITERMARIVEEGPTGLADLYDRLASDAPTPGGSDLPDRERDEEALAKLVERIGGLDYDAETRTVFDPIGVVVGRFATHRISESELAAQKIRALPDLGILTGPLVALDALVLSGAGFEEGVSVGQGLRYWNLPEPMGAIEAGTLVSFRLIGASEIRVEWPAAVGDGLTEKRSLQRLIDIQESDREEGQGFDLTVRFGHGLDPAGSDFAEPQPPLTELMADLGYSNVGDHFGPADEEWDNPDAASRGVLLGRLARDFQLDGCCLAPLLLVGEAWWAHLDEAEPPSAAEEIRLALHHGGVLMAVDALLGQSPTIRPMRRDFLAPLAEGDSIGVSEAKYLLAVGLGYGDPLESERLLKDVVRAEAMPAARLALGMIELDRGDGRRAASYFGQLGISRDNPLMRAAQRHESGPSKPGRNDLCPCGSGQKYKKCHGGQTELGSTVRLIDRITIYLSRVQPFLLEDLHREFPEIGFFADELYLFEGGGVSAYLADRGDLLGETDREQLEEWASTRRSLYEITSATPGAGLGLRNMVDGSLVTVEEAGLQGIEVGEYLLATVVASDSPYVVGNALLVPPSQIDRVLRTIAVGGNPYELAAWWSDALRPASAVNRGDNPEE